MGARVHNAGRIDIPGIAAVLRPTVENWYNAEIELIDPNIKGGTFDRVTNTKVRSGSDGPIVLWTGHARIQAQRWPNVATARQEAISERTVVFHLPFEFSPDYQLLEGWRVHVLDSGQGTQFDDGLFVITSTVNSSYDWDRRIETVSDQGTAVH